MSKKAGMASVARSRSRPPLGVNAPPLGADAPPSTRAEVDPNIQHWAVKDPLGTVSALMDIIYVRRVCDRTDGLGRDAECIAHLWGQIPEITFAFPTEVERDRFLARPLLTIGELNSVMKINYEGTDHCTLRMVQIISAAPSGRRSLLAYILGRFTGRRFVDHAADVGLQGSTVVEILSNAYKGMEAKFSDLNPGDFFATGFQPQVLHHSMARAMSKDLFLNSSTLKDSFGVQDQPRHIDLKDGANARRAKRSVMMEMRDQASAGPFVAKNTFRILCRFKKVLPSDGGYTECGSGGRAFALLARGYPQRMLIKTDSQVASDFFNTLVQELKFDMALLFKRKISAAVSPDHKSWLRRLQAELLETPEGVQFFACESIKILRYLVYRSRMYEYSFRPAGANAGAAEPDLEGGDDSTEGGSQTE